MSAEDGTASESRRDILDAVKGKVKEVAGAVTGNDSLAAQGRAQQASASTRREGEAESAAAAVQAEEAIESISEITQDASNETQVTEDVTDAVEADAQIERDRKHAAAEKEAMALAERGRIDAERAAEARKQEIVEERRDEDKQIAEDVAASREEHDAAIRRAEALERAAADAKKAAESTGDATS